MISTRSQMPAGPRLPRRDVLIVFGGLLLVMLLGALDQTIVATALPTIVGELGGVERLAWVVTAYLLTQTVVTPIYGKLGDLYGRKVVLQAAVLIFVAGSALCGLSATMEQLILFRGFQGLGGGGLIVTTQAVVGDIVSPRERGRYQGYIAAVFAASSLGGPVLGGLLTEYLDWSLIFWINLPLGIAAFAMSFVLLRRVPYRPRPRQLDLVGAGLMMAASVALLLALSWGGRRYAWDSAEIGALAAGSVLLWGLFGWRLVKAADPFLPLTVLGNPVVRSAALAGSCCMGTLVGMTIFVPLYFEVVHHLTASQSGMAL
ncbi:MAG TPA: MFS transporter, partial [Vicinamibacterales bacterium]